MKLFRHSTRTATEPLTNLRTERGAALIIVLVMLLLLTIIGATLFTSSTTEIRISGNQRNSLETFFAADAAVEFATTYGTIYTSIVPRVATTWPTKGQGWILDEDYVSTGKPNTEHPDYNQITIPGDNGRTKVNIRVELIKERADPPPGYGYQVDAGINPGSGGTKFNYFAVSAIAEGPNNARVDVESEIGRMAPQ